MEETEYLTKYVAASLKAYPLLLQFCKDLNEAVGDMRTDAEKEEDRKEHEEIKKFLEKSREHEKQKEYTRGYEHGWNDAEKSAYISFEVGEGLDAVTCSAKRQMSYGEFRKKLADWERIANVGRLV